MKPVFQYEITDRICACVYKIQNSYSISENQWFWILVKLISWLSERKFLFSFNPINKNCELGNVSQLEEVTPDIAKTIYIDVAHLPNITMKCNGGKGCCNKGYKRGKVSILVVASQQWLI